MNDVTDYAYFFYCYACLALATGVGTYAAFALARRQPPNAVVIGAIVAATALSSGVAADFDSPLFAVGLGIGMAMPLWLLVCLTVIVTCRKKSAVFLGVTCGIAAFVSYAVPAILPEVAPDFFRAVAGPERIGWLTGSDAFGAVCIALTIFASAGIPAFVVAVLAVQFVQALARRERRALLIAAIPIAATIAYFGGLRISDAIVLANAGRALRADFASAHSGVVFAPSSRDQRFELVSGDIGAYNMGGFMDTPEYLVFDARPLPDIAGEEHRIHTSLDAGCSAITARLIASNYYFVNIAC